MHWKVLGIALVTFAFLAVVLEGTDVHAVADAWSALEVWRIVAVVGLHLVVLAIRTERFRHLVPGKPPFTALLAVMGASFLAINVMPLRMGELVRPYLLVQRGVRITDAALAVVIERFLDLIALFVLVLLATWWIELPSWQGQEIEALGVDVVVLGRSAIGGSIVLVVVLLVAARGLARTARGGAEPRSWRALVRSMDEAFDALAKRSPQSIAVVVLCTVGSWTGAIAACGLTMGGFPTLAPTVGAVLVDWAATVSAVVLVPTPAFVGAFEAGAVGALVLLGRDADTARAFALVLHAIQLASTLLAGAVGFAVLGVSLPRAVRASRIR